MTRFIKRKVKIQNENNIKNINFVKMGYRGVLLESRKIKRKRLVKQNGPFSYKKDWVSQQR